MSVPNLKDLLEQLVAFPSVTPDDAGCQAYLVHYLQTLGFDCQWINSPPVTNFFARKGTQEPLLVFAGHTDVVATGDRNAWNSDPFVLHEHRGLLFGRGAADMKGSLAAMLKMAETFCQKASEFRGSLGFLITSGEEGDHYNQGTPYVMQALKQQGIQIDYCIVGEPSSNVHLGDVIKIGRRGSINAKIHLQGKQGHVAYPHLADNPIHRISPALKDLTQKEWDQGNAFFPPTSLQITEIRAGGFGTNIIPGDINLQLNIRFSNEQSAEHLKKAVYDCFANYDLYPTVHWQLSGEPFLTEKGKLLSSVQHAIFKITGQQTQLSTSGGTSDGRFIAPYGVEVVELGPVNATIHQVNEHVSLKHLEQLQAIYEDITEQLLR